MPYVWKTEVVEVEQEVSSLDFLGFFDFFEYLRNDVGSSAAAFSDSERLLSPTI
jgi:hypothetical protein